MSKHTPGPWHISNPQKRWNDTCRIYSNSGAKQIAQVSTDGHRNDSDVNTANAELIAQAPDLKQQRDDLLAALKAMVREIQEYDFIGEEGVGGEHENHWSGSPSMQEAIKVLDKAEGKQ